MKHIILAPLLLAIMWIPFSTLAQSPPSAPNAHAHPSVALPPELDRVLRDYEQAWNAKDAAALTSLFAPDGFVLQSNHPPAHGHAAIRAAYEGQGGGTLRLRALAFACAETTAYIIGGYRYGDSATDTGKFTLTLKRAVGQPWLIFSDMDNMNAAPPAPRPSKRGSQP